MGRRSLARVVGRRSILYHASLVGLAMPERIKRLRVDHRGFPVPRFVAWINGQADHRLIQPQWMNEAVKRRLCWVCGEPLGRYYCSIIGCMCAINRVISEPPSHRECGEFAAAACPFMARPQAHRREAGMPEDRVAPAGMGLARNPGVVCLWISREYPKPVRAQFGHDGVLFQLGEPSETVWYREGRLATREEVQAAIDDGLPTLHKVAALEGDDALKELSRWTVRVAPYLPAAA